MVRRTHLYVGCYTDGSPIGIRVYDASDPGGSLVARSEVEGIDHPSFLAAHPGGRVLYAVSETGTVDGGDGGLVAFAVDPVDGSLTVIDHTSSRGAAPCHVSVAADGGHVYVANYLSGTIAAYSLEPDGRFGELIATHQHRGSGPSDRQESAHAHCIVPGPDGTSVHAADLGTDRISRYMHHGTSSGGAFELADELVVDAGSGPRHIAFHPTQSVAFVACELDSTVMTLDVEPASGGLTRRQTISTLPDDFVGESTAAEVRVHPNGHRVYVSNRGHDSLAVFGFSGTARSLEPLGHVPSGGRTPRNFAVHPSGAALLVANQDSNTLVPFEIDVSSGVPSRRDVTYHASQPVCLTFLDLG